MGIVVIEPFMINDVIDTTTDRFIYETTLIQDNVVMRFYIGINTGSTMTIFIRDGGVFYGSPQ